MTSSGTPLPLHGTIEGDCIDYAIHRRRIPPELLQNPTTRAYVAVSDRVVAGARALTERDAVAAALLSGRDGLRSDRFLERVKAANRGTVIRFPAPDHDPEPEPRRHKAA
jgi:hypothetical protein